MARGAGRDAEPGGHLEHPAPPGPSPGPAGEPRPRPRPRAPPPTPASAPPPAPRGSSICIRRWLQGLPGAHVTPGRRREPADLTRAAVRLPLARNSESSRDLRPRPPAANKSAGRLQTQNFHVGKSQDGRERSGARGGEPARECLAAGAGGAGWGACGGRRRGHAGGRPGPGRPEPDHPPPVPGASGHPALRQPPVHPTAPPALSLGGRRVGDGGERLGGRWGRHFPDLLHGCNSCSGAVGRGSGLSELGGRMAAETAGSGGTGRGLRTEGWCWELCARGKVVCIRGPRGARCLLGQGESHRVGGWSGGERTA